MGSDIKYSLKGNYADQAYSSAEPTNARGQSLPGSECLFEVPHGDRQEYDLPFFRWLECGPPVNSG